MPTHAAYHKPCLIHAAKWQREFASQQAARVQFTRSASTVDTTVKRNTTRHRKQGWYCGGDSPWRAVGGCFYTCRPAHELVCPNVLSSTTFSPTGCHVMKQRPEQLALIAWNQPGLGFACPHTPVVYTAHTKELYRLMTAPAEVRHTLATAKGLVTHTRQHRTAQHTQNSHNRSSKTIQPHTSRPSIGQIMIQ